MATTSESIQEIYIGLLGRAADTDGAAYWTAQIDGGTLTLEQLRANIVNEQAEYAAGLGSLTRAQTVAELYQRLFERTADATDLSYWVDGAGSSVNIDQLVLALSNGASAADRVVLDNKTDAAEYYTANTTQANYSADGAQAAVDSVDGTSASVTASKASTDGGSQAAGTTFTLTTGADSITGTSANDTVNGVMDNATAGNNTYTVLDSLDGGSGTDTLNIIANAYANNDTQPTASVTGFETLNLRAVDATTTDTLVFNTAVFTGATTFNSDRSSSEVTFNNVAAGSTLGVIGDGATTQAAFIANYVAGATAGVLNISNGTTAGATTVNGAGLTTWTVNSSGASNVIGALATNSAVLTTVTINAETAFEATSLAIGTNANASEALVIAGAAGDVAATATADARSAVSLGTLDTDFASIDASGLTAGGVEATLSATVAATFTGGTGSDIITTSTSGQTGSIDAGAGTDTLILNASADIDTTAEGAIYKNFEVFQADDGTSLDMDLLTGSTIGSVVLNDASAGATSITDMTATQAANVTVKDFNDAATLGVKDATQVGTNDVLNITISDGDTTGEETLIGAATDGADWTIAGVETINLTVTDNFDADALNSITGMTKLTATGAGAIDIITGAVDMGSNGAIDFSAATGAITFNAAALATNAFAYTGGTGVDTITDNVIGGNVITTGAGNDAITLTDKTGGTAVTTVTAGAGADTTTVNMLGNVARDGMKFVFAAGDSVSDSSTSGISATLTDTITNLDGAALSATAGSSVEFDTEVQATAVTAGTTDVVLGTTTVTNAGDFFVNIDAAATTWIYQDTDGDKIIEAGEFAVALTGIQNSILAAGEFTVTSGDLILATA